MRANLIKWSVVCVLALAGASAHAHSFSSQSGMSLNGASQGDDHEDSFNGRRNRGGENDRGGNGWGKDKDKGWDNGKGWKSGNGVGGGHVSPIPEPSTYALMLAGLGVVGFMARRRRAG